MQIGVNYLKEVEELYEEGKINFIDYFKLYSLNSDLSGLSWCIKNKNLLFHGIIGEKSAFGEKNLIDYTNIDKTNQVLNMSKTPYLSAHICTNNKNQTREETINAIKENARIFKKTFNKEIALENIPYRKYYEHCDYLLEPEIISKLIYDNDLLFLFDISHARKAAEFLNMTLEEYVSKLPMDRVVEFHMAGMYDFPDITNPDIAKKYTRKQLDFIKYNIETKGKRLDNHGKLNEEDYIFLEEAIKKYHTLKYITLEYGSVEYNNFKEDEMTYPVCSFDKINQVVKDEVLEQLLRINEIVKK